MKNQNLKKYSGERVYAEGFGPESKLVKFLKTPVSPKTTGIVSLLIAAGLVVFSGISVFPLFFQGSHINQTAFIKAAQTQTVKTVSIVANGNAVEWTTLVKRSDIKSDQYLLKLPKSATNIKITTITAKQAEAVLKGQPKEQLSLEQRQSIAVATEKQSRAGLLAKITKFFTADLEQAVGDAVDQIIYPAPENPEVAQTEDAVVVDLSVEAITPVEQPEAVLSPTSPETAVETPPPVESITDITSPSDELVIQISEPVEPVSETVLSPTSPETEKFVEVTYETPAPTITEQDTDTGKLVTISSADEGKIDCELLNPNKNTPSASDVLNNAPAGLLNGFTNAFKSIARFFTADLEQAVEQVIETATEPIVEDPLPVLEEAPSTESVPEEVAPLEEIAPAPEPAPVETPQVADDTAYQECLAQQVQLTDVLAYTNIPEIYKVGQESKIKIKWTNNGNQDVQFVAYDTDNNGKLDYVEWTVPHLSEQTFEIIFISKAFQLDENQNIVADIYDQVKTQDNVWASITDGQYVRYTFEQPLNSARDNTIYAKPTDPSQPVSIEVYPVYTDQDGNQTEGPKIATFPSIDHEDTYKVLLTNLQTPTDVFDMRITGNADIDYIVDPTPATVTDNFNDSSKIASSSGVTVANGVVALSASSTWTCGSNLVDSRDAKTYTTILIGSQCWMRQNLNVGARVNGSATQTTTCAASDGSDIQKYCYSDDPTYCTTYGGFYQWNQTMCGSTTAGAQGICPTGWHVPTHDEWTTLELAVCTSGSCATDFPYDTSTTGWRGTNEGTNLRTVDASHFSGLLAGYRGTDGSFYGLSSYSGFWSSLQSGTSAWSRLLDSGYASVSRGTYDKARGFSVRCLKN